MLCWHDGKNIGYSRYFMIDYQLNFANYHQHLVQVTLAFTAQQSQPTLWLPTWIPGSYLIREFARHIGRVVASSQAATAQKVTQSSAQLCPKATKNSWLLPHVNEGDMVVVTYEVYAYDLSVRGAYVDQTRLYGNFTSLCLAVTGQENQAISVTLQCPAAFANASLVCGLMQPPPQPLLPEARQHQHLSQKKSYQLTADSYAQLIDNPFEIAQQQGFQFVAQGIYHNFVLSGLHHANLPRLRQDLSKICGSYLRWLGQHQPVPFSNYLFMTMATGYDYGGLEHHNSTSLITPRNDLPKLDEADEPSKNYQRFLGLCSHEYFHAWLVKTIRPSNMLKPDLQAEVYTPLLWLFEGVTSYYDDLMLYRSGVISNASYVNLLSEQINRYLQTQGRHRQSVSESSFDAWIKLYRADENTANASISYYNKGALVALCLDLTLRQQGHSLDEVIVQLYAEALQPDYHGVSNASLDALLSNKLGQKQWQAFRANYIEGVVELPLKRLLASVGVKLSKYTPKNWLWGMQTSKITATNSHSTSLQGLKVNRVLRGSVAAQAGISAHDVLVAINGIQATEDNLKAANQSSTVVTCHLFRRDELLQVQVDLTDVTTIAKNKVEQVRLFMDNFKAMSRWLEASK